MLRIRENHGPQNRHSPRGAPSQWLVVGAVAIALRRGDVAILAVAVVDVIVLDRRGRRHRLRGLGWFRRGRIGFLNGSTHGFASLSGWSARGTWPTAFDLNLTVFAPDIIRYQQNFPAFFRRIV
jgi:hypothetical protein